MSNHVTTSELDELGLDMVEKMFARGDFIEGTSSYTLVNKWLKRERRDRDLLIECERASKSAALDASRAAKTSNYIALLALIVAALGSFENIQSTIKTLLKYLN